MASSKDLGYSQIVALAGPKGLNNGTLGGIPATADYAVVRAITQNVRWRSDGTDPTASVGNLLIAGGDPIVVRRPQLSTIQFIAAVAGAELAINFYKTG